MLLYHMPVVEELLEDLDETMAKSELYTLEEWNQALSQVFGRQICCPSYRMLDRYLHRAVLDVK